MCAGQDLKVWLKEHGVSQMVAATRLGVWLGSMSAILNGKVSPSLKSAFKIEELTKGQITARRFYEEMEEVEKRNQKLSVVGKQTSGQEVCV